MAGQSIEIPLHLLPVVTLVQWNVLKDLSSHGYTLATDPSWANKCLDTMSKVAAFASQLKSLQSPTLCGNHWRLVLSNSFFI